jgi:uncharacterized protein YbjT (DUF2867 family)
MGAGLALRQGVRNSAKANPKAEAVHFRLRRSLDDLACARRDGSARIDSSATILRPNFFMENFSEGFLAAGVREQNAIYLAAGDGKTSFISVKDIASVAVAALRQSQTGREIDLTGPEALDHFEVAIDHQQSLGPHCGVSLVD